MKRFIVGADRGQTALLPECVDDFVEENNPVRAIDAFVEALDLAELGFDGVKPAGTGRPAYHPAVLLKLYIYGYLNQVHSSRRLEREAGRNLEVMWLLGRLVPDDKVIADFRKDNGLAIRKVCARFVELCRKLGLLTRASVAIDGSKFKAVNDRDKNFTRNKVERRRKQLEESVARYLSQLDTVDRQEPSEALSAKTAHLKEKIAKIGEEMKKLETIEKQMLASPDQQISLTNPARRAATRRQEILACEQAGITAALPKPMTSEAKARGRFGKEDFVYCAGKNVYRCPAGQELNYHFTTTEAGKVLHRYWTTVCGQCALKPQCTTGPQRRITRWEHEHVLEAAQERLDKNPEAMRVRRQTAEHPFGTIKARMGTTPLLMKTLPKVATEMALSVLAYNLTRVMNVIGIKPLIAAIA